MLELQTAVQKLYAFIELAEVHIAEAQVLEKIGIFGILAVEPLQINAASSRRPAARSRRARERLSWSGIADADEAAIIKIAVLAAICPEFSSRIK